MVGADGTVYIGSADRVFYAIGRGGRLRWRVRTGQLIDSAALLDDRGRVYFGSGDGHLYARDARTGAPVWDFAAAPPETTGAFINWFEGNVAIAADGSLIAPNDNFRLYALDRDSGAVRWTFTTRDQTWALPAVDTGSGRLVAGNNYFLGGQPNVFGLDAADGSQRWEAQVNGSVVASPLLTSSGLAIAGGFDGYVHAYDTADGTERWTFAARDHFYSSAAQLPDGTVVVPSADGTIYALDPETGSERWRYDTLNPIRSSPAVDATATSTWDRRRAADRAQPPWATALGDAADARRPGDAQLVARAGPRRDLDRRLGGHGVRRPLRLVSAQGRPG